MTLGRLFDGIGGFPLAGAMCGITPVWASEIEPFPMKVTAARFPEMKQLGSVTDIDGAEIEPVDIITFGSPCQDLSVAGKQLGIHEGQRSNLFFEAVRIIKEMRNADTANGRTGVDIRPRFAVWENVPGAFSSNGGEDFKAVLEALAGVMQDGLDIPRPKKWNHAGCVVGNGWSIAWRVYDAQYWGVPQRRKRIYLVADFASERAPEILFEREGVRGDFAESGTAREGIAADAERGTGRSGAVGCDLYNGTVTGEIAATLNANSGASNTAGPSVLEIAERSTGGNSGAWIGAFMGGHGAKARSIAYCDDGTTPTLKSALSGGNTVPDVCYCCSQETYYQFGENICPTLKRRDYKSSHVVCIGNGQTNNISMKPIANTLDTMSDQQKVMYEYNKPHRKYIVRRLTPTECARLQGMPDWWCEGLGGSDSAIYKAYGNGLALPCAYDVLRRIAKEYDQTAL